MAKLFGGGKLPLGPYVPAANICKRIDRPILDFLSTAFSKKMAFGVAGAFSEVLGHLLGLFIDILDHLFARVLLPPAARRTTCCPEKYCGVGIMSLADFDYFHFSSDFSPLVPKCL